MNGQHDHDLEQQIDRVFQGWPELAAPPTLLRRTMAALEKPAQIDDKSWNKWPIAGRIGFLALAAIALAAVVVGWRSGAPGLLALAQHSLAPFASGLKCMWDVMVALTSTAAVLAEHLGRWFILAVVVSLASGCAVCAGCGTIFVRLALARPVKSL
jgi:hypothetical protein